MTSVGWSESLVCDVNLLHRLGENFKRASGKGFCCLRRWPAGVVDGESSLSLLSFVLFWCSRLRVHWRHLAEAAIKAAHLKEDALLRAGGKLATWALDIRHQAEPCRWKSGTNSWDADLEGERLTRLTRSQSFLSLRQRDHMLWNSLQIPV